MYKPPRGIWDVSTGTLVIAATVLCVLLYFAGPQATPFARPGESGRHGADIGIAQPGEVDLDAARHRATALMREATAIVSSAHRERIGPVDLQSDPNNTGFIGVEWSDTTTTLGDLPAKRTATNPAWAAVLVEWMHEADVGAGDVVWAAFSGSFPGLNVAVLSAAEALGARVVAIGSLGASMWGANVPGFPWSDMEMALRDADVFTGGSVAFTLGGSADKGPMLFGDGVTPLRAAAERTGLPLLEPEDLAAAVTLRLQTYEASGGVERPALFVNVGGGHAVTGDCPTGPTFPAGLSRTAPRCGGDVPGLLYVMADLEIPVIHLLNIKELAFGAGIPLDARFGERQ